MRKWQGSHDKTNRFELSDDFDLWPVPYAREIEKEEIVSFYDFRSGVIRKVY